MKINTMGAANQLPVAEREANSKQERVASRFADELFHTEDKSSHERLTALVDKITAQGQKLSEMPTYAELKAYRKLIGNFLEETISRMYVLESHTGWDVRGRQKMYALVKEIDKKLVGLTEDIRFGQERQLAIMDKLDAIRGMLIDLYT